MKIVADDNIPGIREWCTSLGDIELVDGRQLRRRQLRAAEVLLVRSVTPVNAALLAGTPVRFVGTATSGTDHIDLEFLAARGIQFAAAPGCNSVAVAEYVLACCLAYADESQQSLAQLTVGVVGHGHAGSAVVRLLSVLGVHCLVNDPPRAEHEVGPPYVALAEVLRADIVTLHVPLMTTGPHPTRNMIGEAQIGSLSSHALLINAARGGVLAERDWLEAAGAPRRLALDCWMGEPRIDPALRDACWIASPHIAGHTVDARWRATEMLARELTTFLGASVPRNVRPPPPVPLVLTHDAAMNPLRALVFAGCDPMSYTVAMRTRPESPTSEPAQVFDQLRKRLGARREFSAHTVTGATVNRAQRGLLEALGFTLAA